MIAYPLIPEKILTKEIPPMGTYDPPAKYRRTEGNNDSGTDSAGSQSQKPGIFPRLPTLTPSEIKSLQRNKKRSIAIMRQILRDQKD
jgi:hypothetical protein